MDDVTTFVFDIGAGGNVFSWSWRDPETSKILIWKAEALQPGNEEQILDFAKAILEHDTRDLSLLFFEELGFYEENAPELIEAMKWLSPEERFSSLLSRVSRSNYRHERDYNNDLAPVIQGIFDNSELSLGLIDQSFNDIRYIRDALDFLNLAIPSITSAEDVHKVIEYLEWQITDYNYEPRGEISWAQLSSVLLLAKWRKVELEEEK
jgi:hypothetical protein